METVTEKLETLINQFSVEDTNLCLENRFPYLYTKAYYFLRDGAKNYAVLDALNLPDDSYSSQDIELLKLGCQQILRGIGFNAKKPFENIGIKGCHKLFELFHFKFINQQVRKVKDGMLDKMTFEHLTDKKKIIYYNLV
tara:strand:+ start:51 stop:467 length:417 start_codon:yes stop_codon:yes gene_type:complete